MEGPAVQKEIAQFFVRGRHANASSIYISQVFFDIPKRVRLQFSHIVIFAINNKMEMNLLWRQFGSDLRYEDFVSLYYEAVSEPYSFLLIDKQSPFQAMRYRRRFDSLLCIK